MDTVQKKKHLPSPGLRILKSAIAVELCFLISFLRNNQGIVFFSQLATLWCIQMYIANTKKNALQRMIGTCVGAAYGLVVLLLETNLNLTPATHPFLESLLVSGFVAIVLYTTVVMKKKQASYFSCVVFLSIVVNHISDANPYLFVWNRFLDTMIGIGVGIFVNSFSLPRKKQNDVLFLSGVDDTLLHANDNLSDYNRVELNRMLDEGMKFTISTMRTPASVAEVMGDIRLTLPIIVMNGAALYDTKENRYLKVFSIPADMADKISQMAKEQKIHGFANVIVEDLLMIYYDETEDPVQKKLVAGLRKSLYRNYIKQPLPEGESVAYFMYLNPKEQNQKFYEALSRQEFAKELRFVLYDAEDYPGYSYLKIYEKDATKQNMTSCLLELLGMERTITFGSIPGEYDVVIEPGDTNRTVHQMKKLYEPFFFEAWKKGKR